MKKSRYIFAGMALTLFPLGAGAQTQAKDTTMNRTVVVEQEYNPNIIDAAKINVLPQVEQPSVSKKEVEYDATFSPAANIPANPMQAYTGKEVQPKAMPGYIRLGYGSHGNLDIYGNYRFALSDRGRLNLLLRLDGMNGKVRLPDGNDKWKSHYYRTLASADYTHAFDKVDMDIAANFALSNFNFLPLSARSKQKFTSGDIHFGVKSTDDGLRFRFRAETNLLLYERQHDLTFSGAKESIVRTKAEVIGGISDTQFIGVAFAMDNTFYSSNAYQNHHALDLNPYYLIQDEDWKVRLGAHVDWAFGFGKKLRAAPDMRAEYTFADSYTLYALAKGGKLRNDFRRLESLNPYAQMTEQVDATYEQLNAAFGFKASPTPGVWFNLYGGYQSLKDDLEFFHGSNATATTAVQGATTNLYAGIETRYDYKDLVTFTASGTYRNWKSDEESLPKKSMLAFKPAFEADFRIDVRPVSPVLVSLGYRHIARAKVDGEKLSPVSNLYLSGSYELFKGVSAYARINNLLNKKYQYYRAYLAESTNFVGGVSFRF